MKKICKKIMLMAMAICLLCCSAIVPVCADDEVYVNNWDYLKQLLTYLDDDEEITIVITQNICGDSDDAIVIEADDCTINLKAYYYCEIYPEGGYGRFLEIEGEDVELNIGEHLCIACFSIDDDGGAIYVNEDGFELTGGYFRDCKTTGYNDDGGAICVDGDDCEINSVYFQRCSAGDDGGAIYRCYSADNLLVQNCTFSECSAADEGDDVDGFDDGTTVKNCNSDHSHGFANCDVVGSTLSFGNVIIVAVIAGLAIAVLIILIVLKKKKKIAVANENENDSEIS